MLRRFRFPLLNSTGARRFGLVVLAFLTNACAVVDQYGPRAVAYNMEADSARSALILANIVRAAYRKPLQFSEVASVTGIATAGGTLGASVPVVGTGSILSPQFTASGGPNFAFSNLSTQEFYQASSAELDNNTIALMLNQGFSPQLVFTLAISDIYIDDGRYVKRVRMDVDNYEQFLYSFTAVSGLIKQGLTARQVGDEAALGPSLTRDEARTAAFDILKGQDIAKEPDLKKIDHGGFSLVKSSKKTILCFEPTLEREVIQRESEEKKSAEGIDARDNTNKFISGYKLKRRVYLAVSNGQPDPRFMIDLPESYKCDKGLNRSATESKKQAKTNNEPTITFRARSLQGIYEYVGSLARIELGLDGQETPLAVQTYGKDFFLFNIHRGGGNVGDIATEFDLGPFSLPLDPSGRDGSAQVIKAIAFLQALNSKATTLPAPVTTSILVR